MELTEKKSIRVLHVDDDLNFLKVAKQCLKLLSSFQVDTALSVEEALEKMNKKKFDIIVSDYVMPGKNGLEFLKELRDKGNDIPFIIFTGRGREEVAIKALNLGAVHYFDKNGNPETVYRELAHGIRQAVKRKKTEEAHKESKNYLETILNSIFSGVIVIDEKTHKIIDANPKALKTIGASKEHVIGKICHRFICPAEKGKCPISDLRQIVDRSERVLLRVNGERIPILKTVTAATWRDHKYLVESFIDITERKKAEQEIQESQEKFKRLFMDNPEASVYVNSDFQILEANPRFSELFGYSLDEIKGKYLSDLIVPEDKKEEGEMLDIRAEKAFACYDTVRKRKNGSLVPVSVSAAPIMVEGQPIGYVGLYRDITERKRFEERLAALNTYGRSLNMAKSMEEIYELTLDAIEKTLGFEIAFFMIVDNDMLRVVDHRGYPEFFSIDLPLDGTKRGVSVKVARTGKSINVPDAEKNEDWVEFMPSIRSAVDVPVKIGDKVLGVIGVDSKELAAFNEKDQELLEILASHAATAISNLESQEKFRGLFMDNPEATVYFDLDFHILDVNPQFEGLFGYSLDEIKGKHVNDVIVPKDKIEEGQLLDKKALEGYLYYDTVRRRKDGSLVSVSVSAAPIRVEGKTIGIVGLYKDITESKHYEERLSALHTYNRALNTAQSMEEIYRLTLDAMQTVLGFEYADFFMIDKSMLCIVDQRGYPEPFPLELPLDGSKRGISIKAVNTGSSVLVQDVRKDVDFAEGLPGILSELAVPIKVGQKTLGVLNVESEKLNAFDEKDQELLEMLASHAATAISNLESQEKFKRLFMNNPEAADYLDPNFRILDINPRFEELFGYSLDEIRGKHINDVIVPKDKIEEAKMLDKEAGKGIVSYDTVRKRKDGTLVSVSISAAPIIVEDKLIGSVGLYKDISQLKKTEKTLKDALERLETMNEKLGVVGKFTRHDVRNKLTTVTMNVYLAKQKLGRHHKAVNYLDEIESACRQIEKIFDFAKIYEMLGIEELVYMDVDNTLREAISLFSDLKGVKIVNNCGGLTVLADSLLRQIFYNLIENSLKYGEKTSQIKVYYKEVEESQLKLIYEDDGQGISKEMKKMLFKEGVGKGTGYGLFLIKKICEVYGWTIQETGKHDKGVQFTIAIPKIGKNGKENYQLQ